MFGLFHGFGLATKLQEFALPQNGQLLALTAILIGMTYWRTTRGFLSHAFATNTALMAGGFILMGYQLTGYFIE